MSIQHRKTLCMYSKQLNNLVNSLGIHEKNWNEKSSETENKTLNFGLNRKVNNLHIKVEVCTRGTVLSMEQTRATAEQNPRWGNILEHMCL